MRHLKWNIESTWYQIYILCIILSYEIYAFPCVISRIKIKKEIKECLMDDITIYPYYQIIKYI